MFMAPRANSGPGLCGHTRGALHGGAPWSSHPACDSQQMSESTLVCTVFYVFNDSLRTPGWKESQSIFWSLLTRAGILVI